MWFEEQVNDAASFRSLRLDLMAVCRFFDLPDALFANWESWKRFALPLSFEVSGRPIRLGQRGRGAKEAAKRVESVSLHEDHRPQSLTLGLDAEGKRWWLVTTTGLAHIQVQVLFGDFRPTDFPVPPGWKSPFQGTR
jgi:hypothetical protein